MKKYIVSFIAFITLLYSGQFAFAQNLSDGDPSNDVCINLQTALFKYRSSDATTNGEVSVLQDFLIDKGLLKGQTTGFYGRMTVSAVMAYQRQNGVTATGNVGSLTKSLIQKETCGMTITPLPTPTIISPIPGVKTVSRYRLSSDAKSCVLDTLITNVGLVNGEYVYKSGEYKTEDDCKRANGLVVTGIMCTMEMRLCSDGSTMPRDTSCNWHPENCKVSESTVPPSISSLSSSNVRYGDTVTVYGSNFDGTSYVSLGDYPGMGKDPKKMQVTSYTSNSLTFTVPYDIVPGAYLLYVSNKTIWGYPQSNQVTLVVQSSATSVSQSYISSAFVETNTDGSKVLRVYGNNLTDTVMVNGCKRYSSQKGDTNAMAFFISDAYNYCISSGNDFFIYMTSSMDLTIKSNTYTVKNAPLVKINSLTAGPVPNQVASDATLFRIEVTGENLNSLSYLQVEKPVDGIESITRSSFSEAGDTRIVFNYKVCSGCKYTMSISGTDKNGIKSNALPILIDNSTQTTNLTAKTATLYNTKSAYAPGEVIKFSLLGYDSLGAVTTPAKGFNVQYHMYDIDSHGSRISTQINGVYQADNAVFNYATNMWDISVVAPSANLPSGAMREMEASLYCSSNNLACSNGQIDVKYSFSISPVSPAAVTLDARVTNFMDSDAYPDNYASFIYTISGYSSKYALRVTPNLICGSCSNYDSYRLSLSAAAGETYNNGSVNFYDKNGIYYMFSGSNGSIKLMRNSDNNVGLKLTLEVVDTTTGNVVASTTVVPTVKG